MENAFEKAFYAGIGMAMKGKERIEETAKKLAEDSKLNAEDGKKFVDEMVSKSEDARKDVMNKIDEAVKEAMNRAGYVPKKDYEELEKRLSKIEEELKNARTGSA